MFDILEELLDELILNVGGEIIIAYNCEDRKEQVNYDILVTEDMVNDCYRTEYLKIPKECTICKRCTNQGNLNKLLPWEHIQGIY